MMHIFFCIIYEIPDEYFSSYNCLEDYSISMPTYSIGWRARDTNFQYKGTSSTHLKLMSLLRLRYQ
jgi:hypothetical protein